MPPFLNAATPKNDQRPVVRALYSYLASGENQLTFHENDRIALVGERAKGWQFGENLRTQLFGWFPVAYTENEFDESNQWNATNGQQTTNGHQTQHHPRDHTPDSSLDSTLIEEDEDESTIATKLATYPEENSPRMFGDTIMYRQSKQYRRVSGNSSTNGHMSSNGNIPKPGPPPTLPAPIPSQHVAYGSTSKNQLSQSHSFSSNGGQPIHENRKSMPASLGYNKQVRFGGMRSQKIKGNINEMLNKNQFLSIHSHLA